MLTFEHVRKIMTANGCWRIAAFRLHQGKCMPLLDQTAPAKAP